MFHYWLILCSFFLIADVYAIPRNTLLLAHQKNHQRPDDDLKKAEGFFLEGRELAKNRRYSEALNKFYASYKLVPESSETKYQHIRSTLMFLIAYSHYQLKQYLPARDHLHKYLRYTPSGNYKAQAEKLLSEIASKLQTTLILEGTENIVCQIGEAQAKRTLKLPTSIKVEAGRISVSCVADGFQSRIIEIETDPGAEYRQSIVLQPLPRPLSSHKDHRWIAYILGGAGLATIGGGVVMGGLAMQSNTERNQTLELVTNSTQITDSSESVGKLYLLDTELQQRSLIANIMYSVGGGLVVLGLVMYFVLRPVPPNKTQVTVPKGDSQNFTVMVLK